MEAVFEFDGVLYKTVGEFLDAVAHEYKTGDKDLAVQGLEDYGFSLSDINVVPEHPHPIQEPSEPYEDEAEEEE